MHTISRWEATVNVLVLSQDGAVLLVQRNKPPLVGHWLPPGGHVEQDETPDTAAIREVEEETGVRVRLVDTRPELPKDMDASTPRIVQPHHIQLERIDNEHHHLDFIYIAHPEDCCKLSTSEAQWWSVHETLASDKVPENMKELLRQWLDRI